MKRVPLVYLHHSRGFLEIIMNKQNGEGLSEFLATLAMAACWINALVNDATKESALWFIANLLVFPIGIFRGFMHFFFW